jgi:neopullulanase
MCKAREEMPLLGTPPRGHPAFRLGITVLFSVTALFSSAHLSRAQEIPNPDAPSIFKVEPPDWWVNLTPDVMLLLTGKNLQVTHASCNLSDLIVSRTQSAADGAYLILWLRFGANLKSGTAVCRVVTPKGQASFELPLAARKQILGRNQGLALDDVLYLILPDRFANGDPTNDEPAEFPGSHDRANPRAWHGGDLRGVQEHLLYLKDLGITTLWLTPIVKNGAAQDYRGYGAVDLYAVDPHLGTLKDYQDLVASAHKLHMKVFFDIAPNHVGPLHPWASKPPMSDWFHGTAKDHLTSFSPLKPDYYGQSNKKEITNVFFESLEDPHTPPQIRKNLTDGWLFGILPDLNTENPVVQQYLVQNSIWWAESSGLDGYRIDTFPYVPRKFWAEWHSGLRKYYPRLSTLGEVFHPDPTVTSFFVGGRKGWDGIDTQLTTVFDFPTYFSLRDVLLKNAPAGQIANILRQDSLYPHSDYLVPLFANHDVPRFASMAGSSIAKVKLAFGLTLTLRGVPELYYGDEIAMTGGNDPDNRHDFPGGWQEDPKNAFTAAGRTPQQQEVFAYVQTLLRLRREHEALHSGQLWNLWSDEGSYVFLRETEEEKLVIAFHNGIQERELNISLRDTPGQDAAGAASVLGNAQADISARTLHLRLSAQSLSIFVLQ